MQRNRFESEQRQKHRHQNLHQRKRQRQSPPNQRIRPDRTLLRRRNRKEIEKEKYKKGGEKKRKERKERRKSTSTLNKIQSKKAPITNPSLALTDRNKRPSCFDVLDVQRPTESARFFVSARSSSSKVIDGGRCFCAFSVTLRSFSFPFFFWREIRLTCVFPPKVRMAK